VQIIDLVDEEDPAHGALEYLFGFRRRVADELTDEVISNPGTGKTTVALRMASILHHA
jgi:hypothetical protein